MLVFPVHCCLENKCNNISLFCNKIKRGCTSLKDFNKKEILSSIIKSENMKFDVKIRNSNWYLVMFTCLLLSSCVTEFSSNCVDGNDATETLLVNIGEVTEIRIGFSAKTTIDEGETQKIELIGPKSVIDKIVADSRYSNKEYDMKLNGCSSYDEVELNIVMVKLEGLYVSGSSDVNFLGSFNNVDDVKFETSGSSSMDIDLGNASNVNISISGTAEIIMNGESENFKTEVSGTCVLQGFDFLAKSCTLDISGTGSMEVNVENELTVDISGSADVCYKGTPSVNLDLSGTGNVLNCN